MTFSQPAVAVRSMLWCFCMLALAAFAGLALPAAAQTAPATTDAVEFYNAKLDHYFITADSAEIGLLDAGTTLVGWTRTGKSFKVWPATPQVNGATPVCRLYGNPAKGLDSHFYSASPTECAETLAKFPDSWKLEAYIVFQVTPVSLPAGTCPFGTKAVQRTYNNRGDVNHRYTTDPAVQSAMVQKGYIEEGYGKPPVVMCAPEPVAALPMCQVSASSVNPPAGTAVTLTASCEPAATSYAWSGCNTTGPTCTYTSPIATTLNFAVSGVNASGTGPQVSLPITWTGDGNPPPPSGPVPVCSPSPDIAAPKTGDIVTITANCTNSATRFAWSGPCTANGDKCVAQSTTAGAKSYAVSGANGNGSGADARLTLTWTVGLPTVAPVCTTLGASNTTPYVTTSITLTALCSNLPTSYTWTGCTSTGNACTDTVATPGVKTYRVTAANAIGTSNELSIPVTWQALPAPPVCTLTSSSGATNPAVGANITLTAANCTSVATSFAWSANTGCGTTTTPTCTTTAAAAGPVPYTVTASNIGGTGTPASLTVTWDLQPPVCSILAAPTSSPTVGTNVTLTASCTGNPTGWTWSTNTNCGSTSATCVTTSAAVGSVPYTVAATNAAGTGTAATKDINWLAPSADRCAAFGSMVLNSTISWGQILPLRSIYEGGFPGLGVWTIKVTIPASTPVGRYGNFNIAEFIGPPTQRWMTLSKDACDFRQIDPTGANGPISIGYGTSAQVDWTIGPAFAPGQTYYINVRNSNAGAGFIPSCTEGNCEASLGYQWKSGGP